MARSGATRCAVAPGDVCARGAAWNKATDLPHFLCEAALYICSSGEWSADTKSADAARARLQVTFHEIAWARDRWRCFRCQRYRRNKLTLAALNKDGLRPTVWCCARGYSITSESALVSQDSALRTDHRGAPCAGPTAQTAALRCVIVAQEHVPLTQGTHRLRQLVIGRHPITGAWLLDDAAHPRVESFVRALLFVRWH